MSLFRKLDDSEASELFAPEPEETPAPAPRRVVTWNPRFEMPRPKLTPDVPFSHPDEPCSAICKYYHVAEPPYEVVRVADTLRETWIVVDASRHKVSPEFRTEREAQGWISNREYTRDTPMY